MKNIKTYNDYNKLIIETNNIGTKQKLIPKKISKTILELPVINVKSFSY